jgi:hypothetical protein
VILQGLYSLSGIHVGQDFLNLVKLTDKLGKRLYGGQSYDD